MSLFCSVLRLEVRALRIPVPTVCQSWYWTLTIPPKIEKIEGRNFKVKYLRAHSMFNSSDNYFEPQRRCAWSFANDSLIFEDQCQSNGTGEKWKKMPLLRWKWLYFYFLFLYCSMIKSASYGVSRVVNDIDFVFSGPGRKIRCLPCRNFNFQ